MGKKNVRRVLRGLASLQPTRKGQKGRVAQARSGWGCKVALAVGEKRQGEKRRKKRYKGKLQRAGCAENPAGGIPPAPACKKKVSGGEGKTDLTKEKQGFRFARTDSYFQSVGRVASRWGQTLYGSNIRWGQEGKLRKKRARVGSNKKSTPKIVVRRSGGAYRPNCLKREKGKNENSCPKHISKRSLRPAYFSVASL